MRLVGTDMSRALGRAAPLRRVPPRPGRVGPRVPRRDARGRRARGRRRGPAAVVVRPRRARRRARALRRASPCSSRRPTRSAARTTRRRRYALLRPDRRAGAGLPARRAARPRSRRRRASSATPSATSASSRSSRPARAASASSSASADRREQLLHERPGVAWRCGSRSSSSCSADDRETELLVMELATGGERTIDGIARRPRDRARPPEDARGDARRASRCTSRRSTTRR